MMKRYDAPGQSLPLFEAAGVEVEERPAPAKAKRQRKPRPPTPAERATAARLRGARRPACLCTDTGRRRIGGPRDLSAPRVFGFPLSRNAAVLAETVERLPNFWDDNFEKRWASVGRNYERKLIRHGIPADVAYASARDLLDAALDFRAAHDKREQISK